MPRCRYEGELSIVTRIIVRDDGYAVQGKDRIGSKNVGSLCLPVVIDILAYQQEKKNEEETSSGG